MIGLSYSYSLEVNTPKDCYQIHCVSKKKHPWHFWL